VPVAFLGLNYATSGDKEPYFTRLITNTYNKYANTWADRNNIHTEMIEQAAADRVLFLNEASQAVRHVDLRFPEYVFTLRAKRIWRGGREKSLEERRNIRKQYAWKRKRIERKCANMISTGSSTQDRHGTSLPDKAEPTSTTLLQSTRRRHSSRTSASISRSRRTGFPGSNLSSPSLNALRQLRTAVRRD
jgi:hypothetical protein